MAIKLERGRGGGGFPIHVESGIDFTTLNERIVTEASTSKGLAPIRRIFVAVKFSYYKTCDYVFIFSM